MRREKEVQQHQKRNPPETETYQRERDGEIGQWVEIKETRQIWASAGGESVPVWGGTGAAAVALRTLHGSCTPPGTEGSTGGFRRVMVPLAACQRGQSARKGTLGAVLRGQVASQALGAASCPISCK